MYAIKSLKGLMKNNRLIFVLLVLCTVISTLVIQFSYGIYQNYNVIMDKGECDTKELYIEMNNSSDDYVWLSQAEDFINALPPDIYRYVQNGGIGQSPIAYYETYDDIDFNIISDIVYIFAFDKNGDLTDSEYVKDNYINSFAWEGGRWFTEEEWQQGKKVCIVGLGNGIHRVEPYFDENWKEVFNISYNGKLGKTNIYTDPFGVEYEIIGAQGMMTNVLPLKSVENDHRIDVVFLEFYNTITLDQYNEIKDIVKDRIGDKAQMPEIEFTEPRNQYLFKTILLICGLVSAAAGINFVILFHFIMLKRRKKLGIFRLCGCTSIKCVIMCLAECLMITVPLYAASAFAYDKFIISRLSTYYPYIESANSIKIYCMLGAIYIGITTIITLGMLIKNIFGTSIVSIQKGDK